MDLNVAAHMARNLMNKHGLGYVPFEFDRGKRRMGVAYHRRVNGVNIPLKICLSSYWTQARTPAEVEQTILHEIAHALTPGHKHDAVWKAKARSLGIAGDRCSIPSEEAKAKMETLAPKAWKGKCPQGHEHGMHRKPQRVQVCGLCKGIPTKNRIVTWYSNGQPLDGKHFGPKYQRDMQMVAKM